MKLGGGGEGQKKTPCISGDGSGCVGRVLRLSGCCGGVDSFCKGGVCGCHKRAIVKWMLCHGGTDIGRVVVGMVDKVGYFTNGEMVLITTTI